MRIKNVGLLTVAIAVTLLSFFPVGESQAQGKKKPPPRTDEASVWMMKKLELSKKILQGLTAADFDMIRKNADAMVVVGYLEESDQASNPKYQAELKHFRAANKELTKQARAKNIAAATKAYNQLINSCVECHNVLRDARKK